MRRFDGLDEKRRREAMMNPVFWMALMGMFFAIRWAADGVLRVGMPRVRRVAPVPSAPFVAVGSPELLEAAAAAPESVEELPEAA